MIQSDQEKVTYLANVLRLALLDKVLSPGELSALEEVRKGIDAKKGLLSQAQKAAEADDFSFNRVGSFADQVRNLEDMLFLAMSDNDLDQGETNVAYQFCNMIGIYKDQLDKLVSDAAARWQSKSQKVLCPSCSAEVPAQSRFCQSCGQPLAGFESPSTRVAFEVPKTGYAIEFCDSTAAGFPAALTLAKATGTMQTASKNKKTWYLVDFGQRAFAEVIPLASALAGMRNRKLYFNGEELRWDEAFGFVWCAGARATAYRPNEYCFGREENRINPWGCKQARMEWGEWAPWMSYGSWEKTGLVKSTNVFVFDKERIRHELETNLFRLRFCPHLNTQFIEAVLRNFPDRVEVKDNGPWKYNRAYEAHPGVIKIVERQESGSITFASEYYSDGVRPRDCSQLRDILERSLRECGFTSTSVKALLE